jgi:hypothetical protein
MMPMGNDFVVRVKDKLLNGWLDSWSILAWLPAKQNNNSDFWSCFYKDLLLNPTTWIHLNLEIIIKQIKNSQNQTKSELSTLLPRLIHSQK